MDSITGDLRELSFKQVVDQVFKPNGVKVGGFPEELFVDLTEEQKEQWICNIWYVQGHGLICV